MNPGEFSRCRGCGAPIRWALTLKGRRMPLDPVADPRGNVVLDGGRAVVLGKNPPKRKRGERRYFAHWATCRQVDMFKRADADV